MDFAFSSEHDMMRDQARRYLAEKITSARLHELLESGEPFDGEVWKGIAELGWTATAIPEEHGGIGGSHLDLCVIAEELGRALAPVPFSSSVYLAAEALMTAGNDAAAADWLPKLAAGEAIGTVALPGLSHATGLGLKKGKLSGEIGFVPDAAAADLLICGAAGGLYLVDLAQDGVGREAVDSFDSTRGFAAVRFDGVEAVPLCGDNEARRVVERVLNCGAVLTAFEQVGGAEAALYMARDYALERYAFGRPIGSFQALKHSMADMYMAMELARSNAYYGAWALSSGADELPLAAATARVSASEAFLRCARGAIQVHGGIGFTWEHDAHLYLRRATALSMALGGQGEWKDRLAAQLKARAAA